MSGKLYIKLFGRFRLEYKDEPVLLTNKPRLQELLTYLILHRDLPQTRQSIAFLFWPDSTERQALRNLRQLLFQLRQILPEADHFIKVDLRTLQWTKHSDVRYDVCEFEESLSIAKRAAADDNTSLQEGSLTKAVELYKGTLLASCYEEWILPERERLHQQYHDTLNSLICLLELKRDYEAALGYAKKLLLDDPLMESSYQTIMRLYALNGDKAKALQTYNRCRKMLKEELAASPSSKTEALFKRIMESKPAEPTSNPEEKYLFTEDWPLINREGEWDILLDAWKKSLRGHMQSVFISGDPGIGKTRLARELMQFVGRQGYNTGYTKSYEAAGTLSYGAVTDWLREELLYKQLNQLETIWLQHLVRLLPELLSKYDELIPPKPIKEPWQKKQFLEAITRAILGNNKPRLLLLDDLQWSDSETLAWLEHLFHYDPAAKLLLVGMLRPAEASANKSLQKLITYLQKEDKLTEISLKELNQNYTDELAATIANHKLDKSSLSYIYRETEGNPLFIIESIREGKFWDGQGRIENSKASVEAIHIPAKVRKVILARFEELTPASRKLMELAATIGREFNFNLLVRASGNGEAEVVNLTEELLQQFIIRELGEETYDFTHDKIREVAYLEMSAARRRLFHRKVAESIETLYHDDLWQYCSRLAFHYDRSGNIGKAIHYYRRSGQSARDIFADNEAISYLNRALELSQERPKSEQKDRVERDLLIDSNLSLVPTTGYSSKKVLKNCDRILDICKKLGEPPNATVLRIFATGNIAIGRLNKAIRLGHQLHKHALETANCVELVESDYVLGSAMNWKGKFKEAKKYFSEGVEKYDPNLHREHIQRYGQNPMLICKIRLAGVLWILGETKKAEQMEKEALLEAKSLNHPLSLAYIIAWSCWIQNLKNNLTQCLEMGEQYFEKPIHGEIPSWGANTMALVGSALFRTGKVQRGITLMREGIEINKKINVWIISTYFKCLLAEALAYQGKLEEALTLFDEAFAMIQKTGERWLESEMYRIKGDIFYHIPGKLVEAKTCYQKGLEVARRQGAVSLEKKVLDSLRKI